MFGLIQDPQLTMEKSQMAICDPDTHEVIPEGSASLVDWRKHPLTLRREIAHHPL